MKKINYLFTLLAALMISGNMWAYTLEGNVYKVSNAQDITDVLALTLENLTLDNGAIHLQLTGDISSSSAITLNWAGSRYDQTTYDMQRVPIVLDGAGHAINSSSSTAAVFTKAKFQTTFKNLNINASVTAIGSPSGNFDITIDNCHIRATKYGYSNAVSEAGSTQDAKLTILNSIIENSKVSDYDYEYDYVSNKLSRGLCLYNAGGLKFNMENTTIQGFMYAIYDINGNMPSNSRSFNVTKSTLKGRAAIDIYQAAQATDYTFTDCTMRGLNNQSGSAEAFAVFVVETSTAPLTLTINGGSFASTAFSKAGLENPNAIEPLFDVRSNSGVSVILNNIQFDSDSRATDESKSRIADIVFFNNVFTINGGIFNCTSLIKEIRSSGDKFGKLNINGGTFNLNAILPASAKTDGDSYRGIKISAGTFQTKNDGEENIKALSELGSGSLIADGYKVIVNADESETVVPITTEEKEPTTKTNIDWNTNADWKDGEVPTENSNIQVANGTTVTLAANEEGTANYINLADDAILVVKSGANLTVGDKTNQGVAVIVADNTSKIIVENDGQLVLNGLVQGTDNIEVYAEEGSETALLIKPDVNVYGDENPVGHFFFTSKAKYENSKYTWQRFGVPTANGEVNVTWKNADGSAATSKTAIYEYDYAADDWKYLAANTSGNLTFSTPFTPFQCYDMTINENKPGTVYNFAGSFMGNQNAKFTLVNGWNYLANSYLAPIDLKSFLSDVKEQYGDVAATAYIYRSSDNYWDHVSLADFEDVFGEGPAQTKISPMQAFILQLTKGNGVEAGINYEDNVYDPIVNPAPSAPARKMAKADIESANIRVSNGSFSSKVRLAASNEFTADFDNGFDSYIYEQGEFSIYALAENGHMADLATDNLENVELAFVAKTTGTYTLTMSNVNGEYILRDLANNAIVRMTEGATYTFTANANVTAARFRVESARNMPTSIEEAQVANKQAGVYSINGLYLGEAAAIANMPAGVYIVNGVKIVK